MGGSRVGGLRLRIANSAARHYNVDFAAVSIDDYSVVGAPKELSWFARVVINGATVPGLEAVGPNNSSVLKAIERKLKVIIEQD